MAQLAAGDEFGGCRIEAVIGAGGMGVVYRGIDLMLERPVAIKLIAGERAGDEAARRRFEREARLMAAIDHPNVIPVYAAGEQDGALYLVMRYVDGTDLQRRIRESGAMAPAEAARIVLQVAGALDAAHARGLVHRDIKPANVLLAGEHVYLTDFGITRLIDDPSTHTTDTGAWVGTVDFTSPEHLRGESTDARSDVYSLGCVLYACLTGVPPFARTSTLATVTAHLQDRPPLPSHTHPGLARAFDHVIARALAKAPAHRYASAGELGRAALAAAAGQPMRWGRPGRRGHGSIAASARTASAPGGPAEPAAPPLAPGLAELRAAARPGPAQPAEGPRTAPTRHVVDPAAEALTEVRGPEPEGAAEAPTKVRGSEPEGAAEAPTEVRSPEPGAGAGTPNPPDRPGRTEIQPRSEIPTLRLGPGQRARRGPADDAAAGRGPAPRVARAAVPRLPGGRRGLLGAALALCVVIAIVLASLPGSRPARPHPFSAAQIRGIVDAFARDYSRRDATELAALLAPGVLRVDTGSTQRGRAAVLADYRGQFRTRPLPAAYRIDELLLTPGWVGRASGRYTLRLTDRTILSGHVIFAIQQIDGHPRIGLIATQQDSVGPSAGATTG